MLVNANVRSFIRSFVHSIANDSACEVKHFHINMCVENFYFFRLDFKANDCRRNRSGKLLLLLLYKEV